MAGEDMSNYVSPFAVLTMPEKYNQYIKNNSEAIVKAGMGYQTKLAWTDRKVAMKVMKVAANYGKKSYKLTRQNYQSSYQK